MPAASSRPDPRPPRPVQPLWAGRVIALALALTCAAAPLAGCTSPTPTPRGSSVSQPETSASEVAATGLTTGGFTLPAGAEIVAADTQSGQNRLYRVLVRMPPATVEPFLADAGFTTALTAGVPSSMAPLASYHAGPAAGLSSAQDSHEVQGRHWFREVQVDRADPAGTLVHLWIFQS